jgi:tripartite ATP-independent transporter DctP family solute receptor
MINFFIRHSISIKWFNITLLRLLLGVYCFIQIVSFDGSFCFALSPAPSGKQSSEVASVILKLAHSSRPNYPTAIIAQEVAKEIYTKTNGKIRMEVYDNMQYGEEVDLIKLVQQGKLDLTIVSSGLLSNYEVDESVLDLPYLFSSREEAFQALDGEPGQAVLAKLKNYDITGICFWEYGYRSITTKNRPIIHPEDLKHLRLRVIQNPIYLSFFSKLGALATPTAWGEVIPALESGIIEAEENPIPIIYNNHLEDYQQYLILTEHIFNSQVIIYGNSLKTKLTPSQINLVYSIFRNARLRQRHLTSEQSNTYIRLLQEKGMKIIRPNIEEFRQVGRAYSKQALKKFDPLIQELFRRYLQ